MEYLVIAASLIATAVIYITLFAFYKNASDVEVLSK